MRGIGGGRGVGGQEGGGVRRGGLGGGGKIFNRNLRGVTVFTQRVVGEWNKLPEEVVVGWDLSQHR